MNEKDYIKLLEDKLTQANSRLLEITELVNRAQHDEMRHIHVTEISCVLYEWNQFNRYYLEGYTLR